MAWFLRWLGVAVAWVDLTVLSMVLYAAAWLPERLRPGYRRLFHTWCRCFVRALGVELRLHQHNSQALPEQYILIANHPSAFEDVGIPALFNVRSLAKIQVQDWFVAGRISRAAGTLYLDRDDPDSRREAGDALLEALAQGDSLCVYPEGGCMGRRVHPFRHGLFDLSLRSGVPILPVFLYYEAQEDFEWTPQETLPQKIWAILRARNRVAHAYVFDAITPADFDDKVSYCEHVQARYLAWQQRFLE